MTNHKLYSHPDPLKGFILWVLLFVLIYWLTSCKKEIQIDRYDVVVMWYDLDTTNQRIHEIIQINETRPEYTKHIEEMEDTWGQLCGTVILQQIYYRKNGKKIQPSKYPKN